jgi:hypothetical protein
MGLDASVMCHCFASGRTSEPPCPRDWLEIDEEGYLNPKPEYDSAVPFGTIYGWMQGCCEHPGMACACEALANWPGYRLFQEALASVGWDRFPVLHRELPEANGGKMDAGKAALVLDELADFRDVGFIGSNFCLVDSSGGEEIREHVASYQGIFILDGRSGLNVGFDGNGLFIRDRDGAELFRTTRFRQTLLDPDTDMHGPEPGRVEFVDLDTGQTFECRIAISGNAIPWPDGRMQDDKGRCRFDHPREIHVETRSVLSTDFAYILDPLTRICQASVETGNPVRWE